VQATFSNIMVIKNYALIFIPHNLLLLHLCNYSSNMFWPCWSLPGCI